MPRATFVTLAVKGKKFTPAPPCSITLLVAIPKGKIIESIIQKAVELGARRIVPLLTERVVTQLDDEGAEHKREKWRPAAIEAIKQCGALAAEGGNAADDSRISGARGKV